MNPSSSDSDRAKPAPSAQALIPSLKGKYEQNLSNIICKGHWAMSDSGHSSPDQTSPFEFKLSKALDGSSSYPVNGKYQGWFFLKQPPPFKGLKIEDKDMILKFTKSDGNGYKVEEMVTIGLALSVCMARYQIVVISNYTGNMPLR